MQKKIRILLLYAVMLAALLAGLGITANAKEDTYTRTSTMDLNGTCVSYKATDDTTKSVDPTNTSIADCAEGWLWDAENKILTLNGLNLVITREDGTDEGQASYSDSTGINSNYAIKLPADAIVVVVAGTTNTITDNSTDNASVAIRTNGGATMIKNSSDSNADMEDTLLNINMGSAPDTGDGASYGKGIAIGYYLQTCPYEDERAESITVQNLTLTMNTRRGIQISVNEASDKRWNPSINVDHSKLTHASTESDNRVFQSWTKNGNAAATITNGSSVNTTGAVIICSTEEANFAITNSSEVTLGTNCAIGNLHAKTVEMTVDDSTLNATKLVVSPIQATETMDTSAHFAVTNGSEVTLSDTSWIGNVCAKSVEMTVDDSTLNGKAIWVQGSETVKSDAALTIKNSTVEMTNNDDNNANWGVIASNTVTDIEDSTVSLNINFRGSGQKACLQIQGDKSEGSTGECTIKNSTVICVNNMPGTVYSAGIGISYCKKGSITIDHSTLSAEGKGGIQLKCFDSNELQIINGSTVTGIGTGTCNVTVKERSDADLGSGIGFGYGISKLTVRDSTLTAESTATLNYDAAGNPITPVANSAICAIDSSLEITCQNSTVNLATVNPEKTGIEVDSDKDIRMTVLNNDGCTRAVILLKNGAAIPTNTDGTITIPADQVQTFTAGAGEHTVELTLPTTGNVVINSDGITLPNDSCFTGKDRVTYTLSAAGESTNPMVCEHGELIANLTPKGESTPHTHTPAAPIKENIVPATDDTDGHYNKVVYCSACGAQISLEHINCFYVKDGATRTITENPATKTECTLKTGSTIEYAVSPDDATNVTVMGDNDVCLVTFDYNNANDTTAGIVRKAVCGVASGNKLSSVPNPGSKTDGINTYYFKSWNPVAGSPALTSETEFYSDAAYTAQWVKLNRTYGGGSGNKTTYSVTVPKETIDTISVSCEKAASGQTVTITVAPNEGYELDSLSVQDASGKEVLLTTVEAGSKYTFRMPDSNVTILSNFKESTSETSVPVINPFADVEKSDYFYDAVLWAVENGITNGTDTTHFNPKAITTRAQMVTFLWRASGSPEPAATICNFTDIDKNAYYYKAILWAVEKGIAKGISDTAFAPDSSVTRGQAISFLYRYENNKAVSAENIFTDVSEDKYYYDAVLWAMENGITEGTSENTFSPEIACSRAQIVTFLYRFFVK